MSAFLCAIVCVSSLQQASASDAFFLIPDRRAFLCSTHGGTFRRQTERVPALRSEVRDEDGATASFSSPLWCKALRVRGVWATVCREGQSPESQSDSHERAAIQVSTRTRVRPLFVLLAQASIHTATCVTKSEDAHTQPMLLAICLFCFEYLFVYDSNIHLLSSNIQLLLA